MHAADPGAKLIGVGDGGRHGQQLDVARAIDDGLLPHAAPPWVTQVVHLIQDYQPHVGEAILPCRIPQLILPAVHDVPQNLRRHHHNVGVCIEGPIPGLKPHAVVTKPFPHLGQLLVTESFQRRGVDDMLPSCKHGYSCCLCNGCLARTRRRRHHNRLALQQHLNRACLKGVKRKRESSCQLLHRHIGASEFYQMLQLLYRLLLGDL
mmetsp:Transcript_1262/g.3782  ORF Transcript_1262/g.3782 Transcript_1262/m.3782 type:complete len:207 (+) Transcript_1262:1606-2226(+)